MGEQAAIVGYYPQYKTSAAITLGYWKELEWISIADSTADNLDDFQIATPNRLDAYQVKWTKKPKSITLQSLVKSRKKGPSIFRELADGWRDLKSAFPRRKIFVHYGTNGFPSPSSAVAKGMAASDHFPDFLLRSWLPIHNREKSSLETADKWYPVWKTILKETGLDEAEVIDFARDCHLEFRLGLSPPDLSEKERNNWINLASHLTEGLFENTASLDRKEKLTKKDVAVICRIENELHSRNPHEFKFNERNFQPQHGVEKEITDALEEFESGYVCLSGAPGSGKSTLLTSILRNRSEHIARYYAYTPDTSSTGPIRGEAKNFLHDILKQFESQKLYSESSLPHLFDLDILQTRFRGALRELSSHWEDNRKKTIILIDGLDHIEREQTPDHSLLNVLPPPNEIPRGVLILLGTQTPEILPPRIKAQLEKKRTVETRPLSPPSTKTILRESIPEGLSKPGQLDELVDLTNGHPVTIELVAARLAEATNSDEVSAIVAETDLYDGDIEQNYRSYFEKIQSDVGSDVLEFLSLLARLRNQTLNIERLREWTSPEAFMTFKRKCFHFFHRDGHYWRIFHNSFRLFVTRITAQGVPGEYDKIHDRFLHQKIANLCSKSPHDSPLRWEEIYHLSRAGKDSALQELVTVENFNSQFESGRSIPDIFVDLRIARSSMEGRPDGNLLCRISLITDQFEKRQIYVPNETEDFFRAAISAGNWDTTKKQVIQNGRLTVADTLALVLVRKLINADLFHDANELFTFIDHQGLEGGGLGTGFPHRQRELLATWGSIAIHFRKTEEIIKTIRSYSFWEQRLDGHGVRSGDKIDQSTHQDKTLAELAANLRLEGNFEEAKEVLKSCDLKNLTRREFFYLRLALATTQYQQGEIEAASTNARKVISKYDIADPQEKTNLASLCGLLGMVGEGQCLLVSVPIKLEDSHAAQRFELRKTDLLFARCKVAYFLGETAEPEDLIPPVSGNQKALRFFALEEVRIARYAAWAAKNKFPEVDEFRNFVDSLFWRLTRDRTEWIRSHQISDIQRETGHILTLLIKVCGKAGETALDVLCVKFDSLLDSFCVFTQFSLVAELVDAGAADDCCRNLLNRLESGIDPALDAGSRADLFHQLGDAWMKIGEHQKAASFLRASRKATFGVGYDKDFQLSTWLPVLTLKWDSYPLTIPDDFRRLAGSLVCLNSNNPSSGMSEACHQLLAVSLDKFPSVTVSLWQYFTKERTLSYPHGLAAIIESGINNPNVSAKLLGSVFDNLLLPIESSGMPSIVYDLLVALNANETMCRVTRLKVITTAPVTARNSWLRGIERYELSHSISKRAEEPSAQRIRHTNEYSDYERSTQEAALRVLGSQNMVATVREILDEREAKSREDSNFYSNLDWPELISWILPRLSAKESEALLEIFDGKHRWEEILLTLAPPLIQADKSYLVIRYAKIAIKELKNRSFSDRETRFAVRALLLADSVEGRKKIFEIYTIENSFSPDDWVHFIPSIFDSRDESEFFQTVDSYLNGLLGNADRDAPPLDFPDSSNDLNDADEAVVDLLWNHVEHQTGVLRFGAQRALAMLLTEGESKVIQKIAKALRSDPVDRASAVLIMQSAAIDALHPFDELKPVAAEVMNQFEIDSLCQILEISEIRNWNLERTERAAPNTNQYELSLPPVDPESLPEESQFLCTRLTPLAKVIDVPLSNLIARADSLRESMLSKDAMENTIAAESFSWLDLKFHFRKSHCALTERIFFAILTELIAKGTIQFEAAADLVRVTTTRDSYFVQETPKMRPNWIAQLQEEEDPPPYKIEWIDSGGFYKIPSELPYRVLASQAMFHVPTDNHPLETRILLAAPQNRPNDRVNSCFEFPFFTSPSSRVEDYLGNAGLNQNSSLILASSPYVDTPSRQWLAFNPMIALKLDWHPSLTEAFKWEDRHGNWMAKSVWWQDGQPGCLSTTIKGISSRGWLVVVSERGYQQVIQSFGDLTHSEWIQRARSRSDGSKLCGRILSRELPIS